MATTTSEQPTKVGIYLAMLDRPEIIDAIARGAGLKRLEIRLALYRLVLAEQGKPPKRRKGKKRKC